MTLKRGNSGDTVAKVQARLRALDLYLGPIDGSFGGGTEGAVKTFQKRSGLAADGCVGPATWSRLFPGEQPLASDPAGLPLAQRCLALTGSFETLQHPPDCFCGIGGDFDGQGLSFGALQWNVGQGTLQPLLLRMVQSHRSICEDIFHEHLPTIDSVLASPRARQLAFVRSLQDRRAEVLEPWRGMLKALGRTEQFRAIQTESASAIARRASRLTAEYGLQTERGLALMFDIVVQNGSIPAAAKSHILADFKKLRSGAGEEEKMKIVALRRAAAAKPRFAADVRARKMTIAKGTGVVHGVPYDLDEQFGLRLVRLPEQLQAELNLPR